jgi:coproporphyrinogen III oxidase-like Fe-S oxidoreductase
VDLDVNIEAYDLLRRLIEPTIKKRFTESFGARKSQIVETEMAKLVKSGLVSEKDNQFEPTPKGHTLYNLLAKNKGCCQPM